MDSDVIGPVSDPCFVPDAYDVMLTDVRKQDLEGGVSKVLCQKYLSEPSDVSPSWPLRGTLYGMNIGSSSLQSYAKRVETQNFELQSI